MLAENLEIARQWVVKAQNDLLNADNNLSSQRIPFDTVCFHCQQAAEKFLKAYIAANAFTPPHTHDLLLLLEKILPLNANADILRENLALLMPYAIEIRYPDDGCQPTLEDAQEGRDSAEKIRQWLRAELPAIF